MGKQHFGVEDEGLYLCLPIFGQDHLPNIYLISAMEWRMGSDLLRYRTYNKLDQKSKPEYGINISKENIHIFDRFKLEEVIS